MGRALFGRWLDGPHGPAAPGRRGVTFHGEFASWTELARRGRDLASLLEPGGAYLVDPGAGLEAMAALIAVASTPDTTLLWARRQSVPFDAEPMAPGLYQSRERPAPGPSGPRYATLTSGSAGGPKIPVARGELLELVALQYDLALYQTAFAGSAPVEVLATCLPLEYAAVFMMIIVPALYLARDLVIFPNHRWDVLQELARRERVACLAVPALTAAIRASTPEPVDMQRAAVVFTAGYLSRARSDSLAQRWRGVILLGSYGASETGVMTLDRNPGASPHVGQALAGKPIWIVGADERGVGRVATTGPDCRELYWGREDRLRDDDGVVASTDLGHLDGQGNLYLDGRVDGGEKLRGITIYPREIERHILLLPGVEDVRVKVGGDSGLERLEARVVGEVRSELVHEHCGSLPEAWRPALVDCLPDSLEVYSARGKL
jgi:acyl-coenzyme A synthetase/AMP-(fatty) acid ligase